MQVAVVVELEIQQATDIMVHQLLHHYLELEELDGQASPMEVPLLPLMAIPEIILIGTLLMLNIGKVVAVELVVQMVITAVMVDTMAVAVVEAK
jgi:hypothetical protein